MTISDMEYPVLMIIKKGKQVSSERFTGLPYNTLYDTQSDCISKSSYVSFMWK